LISEFTVSDILTRRRLLHQVGATALMTGACNLRIEAADYCLDEDGNGVLYTDDGPFPTTGECQVTASQIEGPFFVDGAPQTADLVQGEDGTVVTLSGKVFEAGCTAGIAGATVEIWHADESGEYDKKGFDYRCTLTCDQDGAWSLRTIRPGRYPDQGVYRPRHYHVKITVQGTERLVTQFYFEGDEYLSCDPYANSSLIVPFSGNATNGFVGSVDFVLA
jgi:hypothetical protein